MEQDQTEQEILKLEEQLRESAAAEEFFERASGKLIVELLTKEITRLVRDITENKKYLKDHNGYVNAVCELRANKNLLRRLQVGASPIYRGKLNDKLEELESAG